MRVSGNAPKWEGTRLEWGTDRRRIKREFPLAARRYVREHAEDPTALMDLVTLSPSDRDLYWWVGVPRGRYPCEYSTVPL